ncbi:hypothetical protein B0H12DRAFT_1015397, partial [Mycena haematopus]
SSGSFVCAICLGSHSNIANCRSSTLWNGAPAYSHRDGRGKLTNPRGANICLRFQLPQGCHSNEHVHECSGCGSPNHGAAQCPLQAKL